MKLLFDEMIEIPLPELAALGERKLEEDYGRFLEQVRRMDPSKSPGDVLAPADHGPQRRQRDCGRDGGGTKEQAQR